MKRITVPSEIVHSSIVIPIIAFAIVLLIFLFHSVSSKLNSNTNSGPTPTPTPKLTNPGPFTAELPAGWSYEQETRTDSFVGRFMGEGITLLFDYGHFSNSLARDGDPFYDVTYETIDKQSAKLVKSNIPGKGIIGVFFADITRENNESTQSATQKEKITFNMYGENIPPYLVDKVLEIFHSIHFTALGP